MKPVELLYQAAMQHAVKRILIINAHSHALLADLVEQCDQLDLYQHFKPEHACLQRMGLQALTALPDADSKYHQVLILPSKNKQQTRGWMAKAMLLLQDHGTMIMACANTYGAKGYESSLKTLAGNIVSQSKSKCRVFAAKKSTTLDTELLTQWDHSAQAASIANHGLISQPGLFSWDHGDIGSQLLLDHLPANLAGNGMDLCCGYGFLAHHIINTCPNIKQLHVLDADRLALDCAIKNTQSKNTQPYPDNITTHWLDASCDPLPNGLDWIVCNPPFHTGQIRDVELGQSIIQHACQALKKRGVVYIVANRKLPYEALIRSKLSQCSTIIEANGFKIIKGTR